ncbi:hypothetical protein HK101_003055 [Irineochytrium annulatum]|nr:hypothetical protein HK101_003055 [Irineochytrium annulatum]
MAEETMAAAGDVVVEVTPEEDDQLGDVQLGDVPDGDEPEPEPEPEPEEGLPKKRKRGRPPGSLNRPKIVSLARDDERGESEALEDDDGDVHEEDVQQGEGGGDSPPRKRRGRPPGSKNKKRDYSDDDDDEGDGTPKKRRGRPPGSKNKTTGTPGRKKKDSPDKVEEEEYRSDEEDLAFDPKGEEKVSPEGYLKGGRQYKVRTFTLPRKPNRLYAMTMEISKALGYRDSYLFYVKNQHLRRINATDEDKAFLSELDILPSVLRTRPLGIMTARSVFVGFGHRIIRGGRPIRDDYVVGDVDDTEAMLDLNYNEDEEDSGKEEPAAGGGEAIDPSTIQVGMGGGNPLFTVTPAPVATAGAPESKLTAEEEIQRAAIAAAEFNSKLRAQRRDKFHDVHTNVDQVPNYGVLEPSIELNGKKKKQGSTEVPEPEDWISVQANDTLSKFPVALMPGQFQGLHSLYRTRFDDPHQPTVDVASSSSAFQVDAITLRRLPAGYVHVPTLPFPPNHPNFNPSQPGVSGGTPMLMNHILPPNMMGTPNGVMGTPNMNSAGGNALAGMQNPMSMIYPPQGGMPNYSPMGMGMGMGMGMQGGQFMQQQMQRGGGTPRDPNQRRNKDDAPVIHMGPSGKYTVRFTCDEVTKQGKLCQRPVGEAGVRQPAGAADRE